MKSWSKNYFDDDSLKKFASKKINKLGPKALSRLQPSNNYAPLFMSDFLQPLIKSFLQSLLEDPRFKPSSYRVTEKNCEGKIRQLYHLPLEDFLILKALSLSIDKRLQNHLSSSVYSFRKGFSTFRCLQDLQSVLKKKNAPYYIWKGDISSYDQHISHIIIQKQLEKLSTPEEEINLLMKYLRNECAAQQSQFSLFKGLPTGTPIVPPIENLYLIPLDEKLLSLQPLFYGRYGDDFILITNTEEELLQFRSEALKVIEQLGLSLKSEKEKLFLYSPSPVPIGQHKTILSVHSFEHLGLKIKNNLEIGLSQNKAKECRKILRTKIRIMTNALSHIENKQTKVKALCEGLNQFLKSPESHRGTIDYLVYGITCDQERKDWDLYLKQVILKSVFQRFSKKEFRKLQQGFFYKKIPSFFHRSILFQWRKNK